MFAGARSLCLILALAICGCDMPRDVEGTTDAIATAGTIRIGLAENSGDASKDDVQLVSRLINRIERKTGARARIIRATSEPLLLDLEAGELDLVIGSFAAKTPWQSASASPPCSPPGREARPSSNSRPPGAMAKAGGFR